MTGNISLNSNEPLVIAHISTSGNVRILTGSGSEMFDGGDRDVDIVANELTMLRIPAPADEIETDLDQLIVEPAAATFVDTGRQLRFAINAQQVTVNYSRIESLLIVPQGEVKRDGFVNAEDIDTLRTVSWQGMLSPALIRIEMA